MSRNDDYTTGILLDYLYRQKYYKLTGINWSRKTNTTIPQQDNFTQKLKDDGATRSFCCWIAGAKKKLNLSLDSLIITE